MFSTKTNNIFILFSNLFICLKVKADISEFRLHELDEYNAMIGCLSAVKDDFFACNHDIIQLGNNFYNVFPENSTLGKAIKCCGIWMVRDCWYRSAVDNCPKSQLLLIHKMPHKLLPFLHQWCDRWTEDSFICRLPRFWPLFVISLALIIFFAVIACVICIVRRRRNRPQKKSDTDIDIEVQSEENKTKINNNNTSQSNSDDQTQH